MRRMKTLRTLAFLLLLSLPFTLCAQVRPPTRAEFKASIQSVIQQSSNWMATIDLVKSEDLDVKSTIGQEFEKAKDNALVNYNLTIFWARQVQTDESLYAEVSYFSQLQSFESSLDELSSQLGAFKMNSIADQKKVNDWGLALTKLSTGPVNDAWQKGMLYTLDRIQRAEQLCGATSK
jgi:hypothetical protein